MKVFMGKNFTCGVNYQYWELVHNLKRRCEPTNDPGEADVIIFANTCVSHKDRMIMMLNYIEEVLKNKKEGAKVYLTGCLAREFIDNEKFAELNNWLNDNMDLIVPSNRVDLILKDMFKGEFSDYSEHKGYGIIFSDDASLFLTGGCMNKCSFCKTTYQNIPLNSMDFEDAKGFIDRVDAMGLNCLSLRGMNVCQYGLDTSGKYLLPGLIEYAESKENIEHICLLGFAFSDAIKNDFKEVLRNSKKADFLVGSVESGDDRLLDLMHKGYSTDELLDFMKYISEYYHKLIDTNIIAGFPTETLEDVKRTLKFLKELKPYLYRVQIARYHDSSFVPSHMLEQLDKDVINERARIYSKSLRHERINTIII